MRIGLSLDVLHLGSDPLAGLRDQLRRAADTGFTSAWMSNVFGLDALTALAVAGSQVPEVEVGTAVVPTYPRHPAVLAQQALTVQAALSGRLTLGIGLSHKVVIEGMYGYSFERPARHMREYLSVLLPLLDEGSVSFTGETLQATVHLTTPREHRTPVLLAALAPAMLRLAGSHTDGTVLWMTGAQTVADHIVPTLRAAAEEAGRTTPRVVCILPVCVTDEAETARFRASKVFSVYGDLPSYRAVLDHEGAAGPADVVIVGDEDTVAEGVRALADAGVTDFVAAEFARGTEVERTRAFLRALAAN